MNEQHVVVSKMTRCPAYAFTCDPGDGGDRLLVAGLPHRRLHAAIAAVRGAVQLGTSPARALGEAGYAFIPVDLSWNVPLGLFGDGAAPGNWRLAVPEDGRYALQPRCTEPYPDEGTCWSYASDKRWDLAVPESSVVAVSAGVINGEPIRSAVRWESDYWELFDAPVSQIDAEQCEVIPFAALLDLNIDVDAVGAMRARDDTPHAPMFPV